MTVRLCEWRRRLWGSAVERKEAVRNPGHEIRSMVGIELKIMVDQIRSLNQSVAGLEKTIADGGSKLSSLRLSLPIEG